MAKFLSGRQKNIKIGISSYSENLTSLEVIGKVGIGSTAFNPVADLDIRGSLNVRDTLTVGGNLSVAGIGTITTLRSNSGIVTNISGTNLNYIGISTLGLTSTTNLTSQQLFVSGLSTFSGITTHTTSLFGTQASFTGIITASSFRGDGSQLTGVTGTQIVTQDPISTPVFLTFANNIGVTSLGVATTGSNVLSYIPSSGNLGIGTTNPTSKLDVRGDVLVSGVVTATSFRGDGSQLTGVTGTQIVAQDPISTPVFLTFANNTGVTSLGVVTTGSNVLSYIPSSGNLGIGTTNPTSKLDVRGDVLVSGISTLGTVKISSGIVTASSGIVTYYGDGSKLQGIISTAGISVLDEGSQVGTSVTTLNFTGAIISVSNAVNGISTVTVTESGIANYASVAGIATYASNAGIATYASVAGIATYASNAGVATYASVAGIATYASNAGVATYASNAGISTNVIGGIASVTQLSVSGISTLGTVQISSGIITATSGVVTYYGDGSKLTDILASSIVGVSSFATNAGIATNLKGGLVGNVPYQSATDTTVFLTNGSSGTILQSNGVGNAPSWVSAAPAAAITGLTIRDEGTIVGGANSVSQLNFVGAIVSAASSAGIATITFLDYVSNAGIATFATNAGITTALQNSRTFEITGDIVASPISFNGTANVSLAATIQPNSVGLGTDTFGDYVKDISGTANQITVTGGTGEGSTSTLSFPTQVTIPQDLTVTRDLQVNRNLNVTGNITIGGTSATLFTETLKVSDSDIVLGFRTDGSGNDVSNDTTANHGGIAVASTEGNPLVRLAAAGIETLPPTYKKIMWFKAGTFSGLGTDAWLFNYGVGIGSTQFPTGTRLAAGSVQFTENDLAVVRNINASGVVTASNFVGTLTGNVSSATFATTAGIATFATNAGVSTYATNAGIATYATNAGIATYATTAGIATFATTAGIATYATNAGIATYATNAGIATYATNAGIATFATTAGIATNVIGGIGSITQLQVTGISTFTNGPVFIGSASSTGTESQRLQVTGGAYVSGNLGIGTTNPTSKLTVQGDVLVSGASTLGTVQISSGIVTATTGIVTYYGDGSRLTGINAASADSYLFNTGITSSFSAALVGIGSTIFTFPATAGKEYIVLSINCSNVSTGNTEVNVIGAFDFNGGERSYFAYNVPIPTGTAVEIMKQPQVLNPSDRITMRSTNFSRVGTDNIIETYITYQEKTSTSYFGVGLGTVGLGLTDTIGIYTATTYPSVIQSIRLTNVTDSGGYPVSVQITNGLTTTRLVDNLIVPKYASVELLDAPKRIETNSIIQLQLDQAFTINAQVSGSQITS